MNVWKTYTGGVVYFFRVLQKGGGERGKKGRIWHERKGDGILAFNLYQSCSYKIKAYYFLALEFGEH